MPRNIGAGFGSFVLGNVTMLFRAGVLTVLLLALSRLAGVIRESTLAATFGVSAQADLAVVLIGLPDWIAGALGAGVMTYVLIPYWAHADSARAKALTTSVASGLLGVGALLALSMYFLPLFWLDLLLPSFPASQLPQGISGMQINGLALMFALWAVVASAKLLNSSDWIGLHTANLFVTGVILCVLWWHPESAGLEVVAWVAVAVVAGHAARALWVAWRWRRLPISAAHDQIRVVSPDAHSAIRLRATDWLVAAVAVALPYLFPLIARSAAASNGEGSVAEFAFAWKLVELPLTLVLQWVGLLALPSLSRAMACGDKVKEAELLKQAFLLSMILACAAACALVVGRDAWASLLFGWGKMTNDELRRVGALAAWGGLSLMPQALLSVLMTRCAAARQLHHVAFAAMCGFGVLVVSIGLTPYAPTWLPAGVMLQLLLAYLACSVYLLVALDSAVLRALPFGLVFKFAGLLLVFGVAASLVLRSHGGTWMAALATCAVVGGVTALVWGVSQQFRNAFRR